MENDIFMAGVRPGGLTNHNEIKMLVCYLFCRLERQMSFDQLHEALAEHNLVNYFELVQAVEELVRSGHLAVERGEDAAERYAATELGRQAAREFERALPLAVREKAYEAADKQLRRRRREAEVRIDVREAENGFFMELAIPEMEGDLISLRLFLPTREECALVRRRFLNDPVFLYKGILALLTGDRQVLGELMPEQEELF